MDRIAKFEKVSFDEYKNSVLSLIDNRVSIGSELDLMIKSIYDGIKIPKRATVGSAGYDFFAPLDIEIKSGETIKIPTGIRAKINDGWVLQCYPRSGLGFKYRMQLDNTVGIIDSDYYNSDNEGHIFAKFTNDSREGKTISIKKGQGYMQGVFVPYGITADDDADGTRNGGLGSTTKS